MKIQTFPFVRPQASPLLPTLGHDEVHVWHTSTTAEQIASSTFNQLLTNDEVERASRFRFAKHRNEFLLAHAMVNTLLGGYTGTAPREIVLRCGPHGKPELVDGQLCFNLSHTDGWVICAFTAAHRVGIDIEKVRTDFNIMEIAGRFFSVAERDVLRDLPDTEQHEAFFRCWTRKEAFIKALGEGLSHPLHQFDVSIERASAALLATRPDPSDARRWLLQDISLPAGYVGAVAVEIEPQASKPDVFATVSESLHS